MNFKVFMLDPANYTPFYDIPLCDGLAGLGLDVTLLTSRFAYEENGNLARNYVENIFYRLGSFSHAKGVLRKVLCGLEHPCNLLKVAGRIRNANAPAVVHSQWLPLPLLDIRFLRYIKRCGFPLVHTVHNLKPYKESRGSIDDFREIYSLADILIVHTLSTADGLSHEFGVNPSKIYHIPHGTIGENYAVVPQSDARNLLGLKDDDRIVLFFGSLRQEKGLQYLISAFPRVLKSCPSAKLMIVGRPEGMSASQIDAMASKEEISRDRLFFHLEYVPRHEVPLFFGASDVVVYPYTKVDQSGALALGLTLGKAVVVTNVGGLPEIIRDGVNGAIVQPGNALALESVLAKLLSSPEKAEEMGKRAREMALEELGWANIAKKTLQVYRQALRQ